MLVRLLAPLALYVRLLAVSLRAQMQYRGSFIMQTAGHLLVTAGEFVAIWALFERFGSLSGWILPEVALFYGLVNVAFSISDGMTRGFDIFGSLIKSGAFDRMLLRPCSTVLQLLAYELRLSRLGRTLQGIAVAGWALWSLDLNWTAGRIGLLLLMIAGSVCLFNALFIVQATICFWTTESLEIVNTVTYGGVETAQYPIAIYADWFRRFFTYIVPLACVSYFPIVAILDKPDPLGTPLWLQHAAPCAGALFLLAALQVWKFGVRRYTSTGN